MLKLRSSDQHMKIHLPLLIIFFVFLSYLCNFHPVAIATNNSLNLCGNIKTRNNNCAINNYVKVQNPSEGLII